MSDTGETLAEPLPIVTFWVICAKAVDESGAIFELRKHHLRECQDEEVEREPVATAFTVDALHVHLPSDAIKVERSDRGATSIVEVWI